MGPVDGGGPPAMFGGDGEARGSRRRVARARDVRWCSGGCRRRRSGGSGARGSGRGDEGERGELVGGLRRQRGGLGGAVGRKWCGGGALLRRAIAATSGCSARGKEGETKERGRVYIGGVSWGRGDESEQDSGGSGDPPVKEGNREKEGRREALGREERPVGPACQWGRGRSCRIGRPIRRDSDPAKRSWAGSYSYWAPVRFRLKAVFLFFKNRKENKKKEEVDRSKYRGIIYQNSQKNKFHLMDIFPWPK